MKSGAELLVAALGAAGTIILFFGSYAYEPHPGGFFLNNRRAISRSISRRNIGRKWKQRVGLSLLCASFFTQAVTVFI